MYTTFYQLREEPFRLSPDPRFVHLAEPYRAVLMALIEGILLRKGLIVVSGPVGTGKTTLLYSALQILASQSQSKMFVASAFLVNPILTTDEFVEALLEEFEIPFTMASKAQRLTALHQVLLELRQRGGTAVLLIDEAHLLSQEVLEEIRILSNSDSYREKLLQIVLCGQPELEFLIHQPKLRALEQRIAVRGQLRALSAVETRIYIAERLHAAGLRGPSPFPHATLEVLHQFSQGIPRVTNLLCDTCLSIGFAHRSREIGLDIVNEAAQALDLLARPE